MAESRYAQRPFLPGETSVLPASDRSRHVDHYYRILANRRRRYCLYLLLQANEPLSIRDLALGVEASLAPPEAPVTERILDAAVRQLVQTHLPKLRDVGLVQVTDGSVSLAPGPALPIRDVLSTTAAVELDVPETGQLRTEHPPTTAMNPEQSTEDESKIGYQFPLFGVIR